jgi:hypothetical protein
MAMQVPRFGVDSPCQACADRTSPTGVMAWSQIVRLYPTARAATINEIVLWLNRMLGARNICNECANVLERHWCRPGWEPVGNSAWTEVQTLLGTWITCGSDDSYLFDLLDSGC